MDCAEEIWERIAKHNIDGIYYIQMIHPVLKIALKSNKVEMVNKARTIFSYLIKTDFKLQLQQSSLSSQLEKEIDNVTTSPRSESQTFDVIKVLCKNKEDGVRMIEFFDERLESLLQETTPMPPQNEKLKEIDKKEIQQYVTSN
ncbi:MAG: hypothetical protein EZS28_039320, partial [Streblomastix strix]